MKERTWTIGSLPGCDIRVDSPTVSGRHCRLTQQGQTFVLEDLSSTNGTFVAGERIDHPRQVRYGQQITLGLSTPMPWPNLSSITIGRLPENDIVIPLDLVSGRHARLEREGNRVFLIDLESRNGTSLNDPLNKISRAAIQPGDVVFLGTHKIQAAELLAALTEDAPDRVGARQCTRIEASPLADLGVTLSPTAPKSETVQTPVSLMDSYRSARSWAIGIGLSAACVLVVMTASWAFRAGAKNESPVADDRKAGPRPVSITRAPAAISTTTTSAAPPAIPPPVAATSVTATSATTRPASATPKRPPLADQLKGGVLMIQVSLDTGQTWPLATCCAVSDDTVLTTAGAACDLVKFRAEKFRLWVVDPSSGTKFEVQAIRVPAGYQMYAGQPNERQFYDLGFLEVRGKLPKTLPLASGEELKELEDGLPLSSFGFSLEQHTITKFDRYEPGLTPARVFLIKSPPPHAADGPKLLDVRAAFPENVAGSPLIDSQGKIVAVYSKAAPPVDVGGVKDLHLAVVASPKLIDAWLHDRDAKTWTTLSSAEGTSQSPPRP